MDVWFYGYEGLDWMLTLPHTTEVHTVPNARSTSTQVKPGGPLAHFLGVCEYVHANLLTTRDMLQLTAHTQSPKMDSYSWAAGGDPEPHQLAHILLSASSSHAQADKCLKTSRSYLAWS